jgi:hypothetical protein
MSFGLGGSGVDEGVVAGVGVGAVDAMPSEVVMLMNGEAKTSSGAGAQRTYIVAIEICIY